MTTNALLRALVALLILTASTWAGDGVGDSTWTDGNVTVTIDVSDGLASSCNVSFTDSSGSSSTVPGADGSNSTYTNPTCSESDATTTPGGQGYRVKDGKVQKKNRDGTWSNLRKKKKPKKVDTLGFRADLGGEEVVSLPH